MEDLVRLLHDGKFSLVVANGDVCTFNGHGISDLYKLFNEAPGFLRGASLADKIVGKAAAALMVLGEVREVYADIICLSAIDLLRNNKIQFDYGIVVPNITNRAKTGLCPLEKRCCSSLTPQDCLNQIKEFIEIQTNKWGNNIYYLQHLY